MNSESVYSVCWDESTSSLGSSPPAERSAHAVTSVFPISQLGETTGAMQFGIERDELELDVMGVESWKHRTPRSQRGHGQGRWSSI
jgi:hypothetical protein